MKYVYLICICFFSILIGGCGKQDPAEVFSIYEINKPKVIQQQKPKITNIVKTNNIKEPITTKKTVIHSQQRFDSSWIWPIKGQILSKFIQGSTIKKNGINISGIEGAPIKAVSSGKVVYSGNSLRGYGNLIIIKHDNVFLSAYAHNKRNLVTEGMNVIKGQKIAEMGKTGTDKVMLHFEIRKNGVPVDPEKLLPK